MEKLNVELENCFGIGKLKYEFDFKKSNTFLIYAPNGTMKTSFARTFDLISKDDSKNQPCDRIYVDRIPKFKVLADDIEILPEKILVVNAEDSSFDSSSKISNFLASKELKSKYDEIYLKLNERKTDFIKKLKIISQSTDCETELISSFSENSNITFFDILLFLEKSLKNKFDKLQFKYNDVFDKKGNVKKFLDKNQSILNQYISNYKSIISTSKFFKESVNSTFGTYQANEIIKSIEDNSFFDAGHKFILDDGTKIDNSELLKQIVQNEILNIINDEKLKQSFEKVDKAIGANLELRSFQKVIEKDNLILVNLKDYDKYRQQVWINYLSEIKDDADDLSQFYFSQKVELQKIIIESKKEFAQWKKIIKTFNSRFYVPFKVILANQEDIVLKEETANLEFEYSDRDDVPVKQKKDNLLNILSKGEQRAYFILQFLFEIESRKLTTDQNLLIFDDVADSFDYKNKFAIIEYIKELHQSDNFKLILLTHNFDFYRTVASRLYLDWEVAYMVTKTLNKEIDFHKGVYRNDVFTNFIRRFAEPKIFISLIAFVRNLIEYSESKKCLDYLTLTNCLHKKSTSDDLTADEIFSIYKKRLIKLQEKSISFGGDNLIQMILKTAEDICNEVSVDEIFLENKITLAIAIRLKTEEYLISKLPGMDLNAITKNQTQELLNHYRKEFPESSSLDVLDKVNLMTPENIHINAFMYEPLIDMSVHHLVSLYKETCEF